MKQRTAHALFMIFHLLLLVVSLPLCYWCLTFGYILQSDASLNATLVPFACFSAIFLYFLCFLTAMSILIRRKIGKLSLYALITLSVLTVIWSFFLREYFLLILLPLYLILPLCIFSLQKERKYA